MMDWKQAYWIARRYVRNHADAEDVVQDAMLAMHAKADQFRGESKASTWGTTVVVRTAINRLRSRRRTEARHDRLALISPRTTTNPVGGLDLLAALGASMSGNEWGVIKRTLEGEKPSAIARELGMPAATVRSHLMRARKKIAGQLGWE